MIPIGGMIIPSSMMTTLMMPHHTAIISGETPGIIVAPSFCTTGSTSGSVISIAEISAKLGRQPPAEN